MTKAGEETPSLDRARWAEVLAYATVVIGSLLIAAWALNLWTADLSVPFAYGQDATLTGSIVKGTIEHGWFQTNPSLGAPGVQSLSDYPVGDVLHVALMKLISLAIPQWALVMNLYYLLTFPLVAATALWSMRTLGVSRVAAVGASLLYAALPYHFFRGEGHLFLSAYFLVPPMIVVVLWCLNPERFSLVRRAGGRSRLNLGGWKAVFTLAVCALMGLGGVYYAFFACLFLAVAGVLAYFRGGGRRALATAGLPICVIVLSAALALAPSLVYRVQHGSNPAALDRSPMGAEAYGLKIDQMFLPVDGHRVAKLASLKAHYRSSLASMSPLLDNEATTTSPLGIVGCLGLLLVVGWVVTGERARRWVGDRTDSLLRDSGALALSGILLATVGGIGAMVAFVLPQIRAYNRIVVYLAFFAFLGLALVLDRLRGCAKTRAWWVSAIAVCALVVAFGLLDQVPAFSFREPGAATAFRTDAAFVGRMESALPPGAAVFQLPYLEFPEASVLPGKMVDYDPLRGYLHSRALRWSYGAMKGRETANWQKRVAALPVPAMLGELRSAGLSAVWIDRVGYADGGQVLEAGLRDALATSPVVSEDGRFAVYSLHP